MPHNIFDEPVARYKHTHAIIDRILFPFPPEEWHAVPIVSEVLKPQEALYPWLVSLNSLNVEATQALMALMEQSMLPPYIILIHSDHDENTLRCRLADALIIQPQWSSERFLLRYYDPRVFLQLARILPHDQLNNIAQRAGINFCTWRDGPSETTLRFEGSPLFTVNIEPDAFHRMMNIGLINQVIQRCKFCGNVRERIQLSNSVEELIICATKEFGLLDTDDIKSFTTKGVTIHPKFYVSPVIKEILHYAKENPGGFDDEIELLSDSDWEHIINDCHLLVTEKDVIHVM